MKKSLGLFTTMWALLLATQVTTQVMPSSSNPPWGTRHPRRGVDSVTSGTTEKAPSSDSFYSDWPWWWWIAAVTGAAVFVAVLVAVCVCCCCYIHAINKRSKVVLAEAGKAGRGDLAETGGLENPTLNRADFRRMSSSPAKRYLHNIVSIFSWGSDFDREDNLRPSPFSNPVYANPKEMHEVSESNSLVVPPPRPPKPGENHYLNVPPIK